MKSTIGGVLTNIWQPARELYFGLLLHGIVKIFWILNLRRLEKSRESSPFYMAGELVLVFVSRNCEHFHFGLK